MSDFFEAFSVGLTVMYSVVQIWTIVVCWKYINTTVPSRDPEFIALTLPKVFAALLGVLLSLAGVGFASEGDWILVATLLGLGALTFGLLFLNLKKQLGWEYALLGLAVLMASSYMIIFMIIILVAFAYLVNDSKGGTRARRAAERDIQRASMDI